jgi:acetylornithine deacetylase/succinyl-diaminopimelate desuccinylase-like protein
MTHVLDAATRSEIVDFCRALVRTPSVNGVHAEREVAEVVVDFSRSQGLHTEVVARDPQRPNVLVGLKRARRPGLILVAHMDTVSAGDESRWTVPPFAGRMAGGRLIGRGSADNKGGLAAAVAALLTLRSLAGSAVETIVACVSDEESGASGELGVRHVFGNRAFDGASAIYTYPGMRRVVVGHGGVLRYVIRVSGRAIHSGSAAWRNGTGGASAIEAAVAMIQSMQERLLEPLGKRRGIMVTPTVIHGGSDANVVPGHCELTIDARYKSSSEQDRVETEVRAACDEVAASRRHVGYSLRRVAHVPPTAISAGEPLVRSLREALGPDAQRPIPVTISGPANESYILNAMGLPTCAFGPRGGNVHSPNEYVVVDSLFDAASVYARTSVNLAVNAGAHEP